MLPKRPRLHAARRRFAILLPGRHDLLEWCMLPRPARLCFADSAQRQVLLPSKHRVPERPLRLRSEHGAVWPDVLPGRHHLYEGRMLSETSDLPPEGQGRRDLLPISLDLRQKQVRAPQAHPCFSSDRGCGAADHLPGGDHSDRIVLLPRRARVFLAGQKHHILLSRNDGVQQRPVRLSAEYDRVPWARTFPVGVLFQRHRLRERHVLRTKTGLRLARWADDLLSSHHGLRARTVRLPGRWLALFQLPRSDVLPGRNDLHRHVARATGHGRCMTFAADGFVLFD
jgi:hypothetical protein